MRIKVERKYKKPDYTIGKLYIEDVYFCDTLEDTWRASGKIPGKTAIPDGTYNINMETVSPRFSRSPLYSFCGGKLPRLQGVPGFSGVLIHIGNTAADTEGCILVGRNTIKGKITESTVTFKRLYQQLQKAHEKGDSICITLR